MERLASGHTGQKRLAHALGVHPARVVCRDYIQSSLAGDEIPEKSAQRIFAAADKILRAGAAVAPEPAS